MAFDSYNVGDQFQYGVEFNARSFHGFMDDLRYCGDTCMMVPEQHRDFMEFCDRIENHTVGSEDGTRVCIMLELADVSHLLEYLFGFMHVTKNVLHEME